MDEKKKKLIKILLIILGVTIVLSIVLFLLLPKSNREVELTFWGFWEEEEAMHPLIEKYEAEKKQRQIELLSRVGVGAQTRAIKIKLVDGRRFRRQALGLRGRRGLA